jgi:hypothetical protein
VLPARGRGDHVRCGVAAEAAGGGDRWLTPMMETPASSTGEPQAGRFKGAKAGSHRRLVNIEFASFRYGDPCA